MHVMHVIIVQIQNNFNAMISLIPASRCIMLSLENYLLQNHGETISRRIYYQFYFVGCKLSVELLHNVFYIDRLSLPSFKLIHVYT